MFKPTLLGLTLIAIPFLRSYDTNASTSLALQILTSLTAMFSGTIVLKKVWNRSHFLFYRENLNQCNVEIPAVKSSGEAVKFSKPR